MVVRGSTQGFDPSWNLAQYKSEVEKTGFLTTFYRTLVETTLGCSFFTTEDGNLGVGSGNQEGDIIVALRTAKFFYALRPCQESHLQGKFRLVGSCFFYDQQPMNHEKYLPTVESPLETFELV